MFSSRPHTAETAGLVAILRAEAFNGDPRVSNPALGRANGFPERTRQNCKFLREGFDEMSLGIWKKLAALLSVICISVALNGCGPAAETPTGGDGADATEETTDENGDESVEDVSDEDGGAEDEAASITE
jgi:hypothetical protein